MAAKWYQYTSDDGINYAIKIPIASQATAGGFTTSVSPPPATNAWPYKGKDIRHVNGVDSTGAIRGRLRIATAAFALFQDGGTWTNTKGTVLTVTGAEGERRPGSHLS